MTASWIFTIAADAAAPQTLWDWMLLGGPTMIFIAFCLIAGLSLSIERFLALRRSDNIPVDFILSIKQVLDLQGYAKALAYCQQKPSSIAKVVRSAIARFGSTRIELETAARDEAGRLLFDMKRNIRLIGMLSQISPLLGLGGTVLGMIGAFRNFNSGQTDAMGGDISVALITTLAGLAVAIVLFLLYHWLSDRAEQIVREIEDETTAFILDVVDKFGDSLQTITHPAKGGDFEADIPTAEISDSDAKEIIGEVLNEKKE